MELSEKFKEFIGLPEPRQPTEIAKEFLSLAEQRKDAPKEVQNVLAPVEHAVYAEGVVTDEPMAAIPLAVYTPVYSAGKATELIKARSDPSWEEIKQGYKGIGKGLYNAVFNKLKEKRKIDLNFK